MTCEPCEHGEHLKCPTTKTQTVCCCYYPWKESGELSNAWDRYYHTLPADLKRKLSVYDLRRLGRGFYAGFEPLLKVPRAVECVDCGALLAKQYRCEGCENRRRSIPVY